MHIKNTEVEIRKGDITKLKVGALVNPANSALVMNEGLALAIKKKGGQRIEDEAVKKAPLKPGGAVETRAGKLSAKFVIHAVTVDENRGTNENIIRSSCRNSLELAKRLKLKSIAFPALGCGKGGFSPKASAKIMAQEILKHAKYDAQALKQVVIVLYDDETFGIFKKQALGYVDYIQHKLSSGPFITVDIIIEVAGGIVLIERSNPPFGWALPGGFVDYGETLEACAKREAKEETGLDVYNLVQMHTYSDPSRDPRFHTITTVFVAQAKGKPCAGDDAQDEKVVSLEETLQLPLAFNHQDVLKDYQSFQSRTGTEFIV